MKNINSNDRIRKEVLKALEIFSLKSNFGKSGDNNFRIYSDYQSFYETPYYYNEKKLLHFTSLRNLCEILNSNSLRMYSLYNCNDKLELEYWNGMFRNEDYDFYKGQHILSLSLTKPDKYNDLSMWRMYGDNGNGVCIELEIVNEQREWKNFILAPVNYKNGEELARKYYKHIDKLRRQFASNIDIDLSPIIPFFKSSDWQQEHEVRMIYYKGEPTDDFTIKRLQSIKDQRIVNYIPFPLNHYSKHMEFSKIDETIPKLKISKIYTGFQSTDPRFALLEGILRNYSTSILEDSSLIVSLEALNINSIIR